MAAHPIPDRIKLGTTSNREAAQLAAMLDLMRAREGSGMPVVKLDRTPVSEHYDTRHLVRVMRRSQIKSRAGTLLFMLLSMAGAAAWVGGQL